MNFFRRNSRVIRLTASTAVGLSLLLTGCGGSSSSDTTGVAGGLQVHYGLAPVDGGVCTLTGPGGQTLAGPVKTQSGRASFGVLSSATGLGMVSCTGGSYLDTATGASSPSVKLRTYVNLNSSSVAVTPLTEIAVRLLGARNPSTAFTAVQTSIANAFGLEKIDITTVFPSDISKTAVVDTNESRYGTSLAALSQLAIRGTVGKDASNVIDGLASNFDSTGYIKDDAVHVEYAMALADLLGNKRLAANLGSVGEVVLEALFDNVSDEDPLANVSYVNTDFSSTRTGFSQTLVAGKPAQIAIVGTDLSLVLGVKLGSAVCTLQDLESMDEPEVDTKDEQMIAVCPPPAAGKALLTIADLGEEIFQTEMIVTSATTSQSRERAKAVHVAPRSGTGPTNVVGTITADAPSVNTSTGAHDYVQLRKFPVRGVVLELLDAANNHAVLMETDADDAGNYRFAGVDEGKSVVVRVKAQLRSTRAAGVTTGPEWDISVRDNTSAGSPKAMYTLDSDAVTTVVGDVTINVNAAVGFDAQGNANTDGNSRQSAAFSVLEVIYSGTRKILETDPNLSMPALNVYWSPANVGTGGDREKGQIGTSHFASGGAMPGLFILGKADADTDEFDQGVLGHEFGHYLQSALSYSDNPGGSHAVGDFKDASLAYGEGYGTALGGLLIGSPFYIDTSGPRQGNGSITNLTIATPDGKRKGFYSEESVGYVMYNMGVRHGFGPFWRAVSSMRVGHESATLFSFLARFTEANPSATIADLLTTENVRTTDLLGNLAAEIAPDAAIGATASGGANDLEKLYIAMVLNEVGVGAEPVKASADSTSFCFNSNLPGARIGNGLGMFKRFSFTANFTGQIGVKALGDQGAVLDSKDYTLAARENTGSNPSLLTWEPGYAKLNVVQGRVYTLRFSVDSPATLFQGNNCGNALSLWRLPDTA